MPAQIIPANISNTFTNECIKEEVGICLAKAKGTAGKQTVTLNDNKDSKILKTLFMLLAYTSLSYLQDLDDS